MAEDRTHLPEQDPLKQQRKKLRAVGTALLIGGLAVAAVIYAFAPIQVPEDDPSLAEYFDKRDLAARQMWGNEGPLMVSILDSLKRPTTYSVIIAVVSVLGSGVCFWLAQEPKDVGEAKGK